MKTWFFPVPPSFSSLPFSLCLSSEPVRVPFMTNYPIPVQAIKPYFLPRCDELDCPSNFRGDWSFRFDGRINRN